MTVRERIAALAGIRGNDLKAAKKQIVETLEPGALGHFLAVATPAEIKKLTDLFQRDFLDLPSERVVPCYEATYGESIVARPKLDKALGLLRSMLVHKLDSPTALTCLERHPDDASLLERVSVTGTVGELRRAAAMGKPSPKLVELVGTLRDAPERLSVEAATALVTLGCTWRPAPEVASYPSVYRSGKGYWKGVDPDGQLPPPEGGGWLVVSCAVFPNETYKTKVHSWDGEPSTVRLGGGGEVVDVEEGGRRRVLAPIGYIEEKQYYFSVDLADPSPSPVVFTIDHDGTGPAPYKGMMMFCYGLTQ